MPEGGQIPPGEKRAVEALAFAERIAAALERIAAALEQLTAVADGPADDA